MSPYGIGTFVQSLVNVANALVVPNLTTLAGSVTNSQTTLPITAWQSIWPLSAFSIKIDAEIIDVTGGFGTTTLTVTRVHTPTTHASLAAISWYHPLRMQEGICQQDLSTTAGRELIQRLQTDGIVLAISGRTRETDEDIGGEHGLYRVNAILYFAVTANKLTSLIPYDTFMEYLRLAWRDSTNFILAGTPSSASKVTWGTAFFDYTQSPAFGQIEIRIETRI